MTVLFANNASAFLAIAVVPGDTVVRVAPGAGAKFPAPSGGDHFMVTLEDRRTGQIEICKCTTRVNDILTVVRAQEGTTAQSFMVNATVSNRLTAGTILLSGGATISVSDNPPSSPVDSQLWWESDTGAGFIRYNDGDSTQWVQWGGTGGGSGGGDDISSSPVAAIGSTLQRTMPEWLAGAPVIEIPGDAAISPNYRGAWLHMMNAIGSSIFLPDNWSVGMSFGARQMGTGPVTWWTTGNATMQLPFTRNEHTSIAEQYEEVIFRVVANSDGSHAVWGVAGATG